MTSAVRHERLDFAGPGEMPRPVQVNGAMIYTARVARTGDHVYSWGTERRDTAELYRVASQLAGKPVVIKHPNGLISNGAKAKVVGQMIRGWVDGNYAVAEIRVDDAEVLTALHAGIRELSLGYSTNPDYAGYQRDTRVDHLALVERGKCGGACAIRVDHCGCLQDSGQGGRMQAPSQSMAISNLILARKPR